MLTGYRIPLHPVARREPQADDSDAKALVRIAAVRNIPLAGIRD